MSTYRSFPLSLFLGAVTSTSPYPFQAQALQPSPFPRSFPSLFCFVLSQYSFICSSAIPGEPARWAPPTGLGMNCPTLTPREITLHIKLPPPQSNHLMPPPQLPKPKNKRTNLRCPPISDNLPPAHCVNQDPAIVPNLRQHLTPQLHS